jgi:hypothetical protein
MVVTRWVISSSWASFCRVGDAWCGALELVKIQPVPTLSRVDDVFGKHRVIDVVPIPPTIGDAGTFASQSTQAGPAAGFH